MHVLLLMAWRRKGHYPQFLDVRARPLRDLGGRHRAALARDFLAAFEEDHGGNAADPVAAGDLLFGFRIELAQADTGFEGACRRFELGCHYFAGTAPFCPEINQQGQFGIRMTVKISRYKRDGPALKERRAAASAIGIVGQTLWNCTAGKRP